MAIYNKYYNGDASQIHIFDGKVLKECIRVLVYSGGILKEVWDYITGYLFTSDGYVYQTSDGYLYKCSDQ